MPKPSKGKKFYAVQIGRQTGVFLTWEDCEKQTKGYSGAKYQSFTNAGDAEAFVSGSSKDLGPSAPSTCTSGVVTSDAKGKKRAMSRDIPDESENDVVYCDGACKGNGQVGSIAGVGVWWEENDPRNIAERCPGDQTNNRAELIAIVRMLETTPKSKKPLLIKTDSQYCIKSFLQWLPKWERNNFRTAGGAPVKNAEIIRYVSALLEVRALMGQPVRMEYVKGHSGDRGNDGADAQANKGAMLPPVPERDWAKAKQELLELFKEERRLSEDQPTPVPLNVNAGDLVQSTNQPHKVRKVSHDLPFSRLSSVSTSRHPRGSRLPSTNSSTALRSPAPPHRGSRLPSTDSSVVLPSPSPPHVTSPPPLLPVVDVSSSPTQETVLSQARLTPTPSLPPCKIDSTPLPIVDISSSPLQETANPPCKVDSAPQGPEAAEVANHMDSQSTTITKEPHESLKTSKTSVRKHGVGLFTTTPPPNADLVKKVSPPLCEFGEVKDKESELVPQLEFEKRNEKNEKPTAMSVDVADVNLNDYLDCVDDDDDPFDGL